MPPRPSALHTSETRERGKGSIGKGEISSRSAELWPRLLPKSVCMLQRASRLHCGYSVPVTCYDFPCAARATRVSQLAKWRARLLRFEKIASSSTAEGEKKNAQKLATQAASATTPQPISRVVSACVWTYYDSRPAPACCRYVWCVLQAKDKLEQLEAQEHVQQEGSDQE